MSADPMRINQRVKDMLEAIAEEIAPIRAPATPLAGCLAEPPRTPTAVPPSAAPLARVEPAPPMLPVAQSASSIMAPPRAAPPSSSLWSRPPEALLEPTPPVHVSGTERRSRGDHFGTSGRKRSVLATKGDAGDSLRGQASFFVARLIPSLLGLLTTALLTRYLEPAAYGLYAFGLSVVFLMTTGLFEWLGLSLMRLAPTAQLNQSFFSTVVSCFVLMAIVAGVANVTLAILGWPTASVAFAVGCFCAGTASAWTELKQRLQTAELERRAYFLTAAFRGVATSILVIGAALFNAGVPVMLFAVAGANWLAGFIAPEPRLAFRQLRFDKEIGGRLLAFGFPLSISVGLSTVLMSIDKWMLQAISGSASVGFFTAATLIAQVPILTLASCLAPSTFALVVRAVEFGAPEQARKQLAQSFTVLLAVVLPAAVGVVAVGHTAAQVALGPAYWHPVSELVPWLAATAVLSAIRAFYVDYAFQIAHKTRVLVWVTALAVVINVVLDVLLVPLYAERGAAMGSFFAYVVSLTVASVLSRRAYPLPVPLVPVAQIFAATLVMLGFVVVVPKFNPAVQLGLRTAVGMLSFSVAVVGLNVLGLRDRVGSALMRISAGNA